MALHPPRNTRYPISSRAESPVDLDPYSLKQSYSAGDSATSTQPASPYPRETDDRDFFVLQQRQNTLGLGASTSTRPEKTGYSRWQWTFLAVVVVQAIIGLAIEGFVFGTFQTNLAGWARQESSSKPYAATLPTYLALFIFGFVYEVGLVWDALRMKNTIQIIGLCLYNVGLLIEAAVQFLQLSDVVNYLGEQGPPKAGEGPALQHSFMGNVRPYIIAMPAVIGLGTVLMAVSTFYLYKEFSWSVFERFGADTGLKKALRYYEVYLSLLKFDFFFFLAFTVLFLVVVTETSDLEFYLTIAAIPITIFIFILALFWVKRESRSGMLATIALYFAALAYFFFKLIRMYWGPANRVSDYLPARRSLTTFAVLTIILLVTTIAIAITCMLNFDRGLRGMLVAKNKKKRPRSYQSEMVNLNYVSPSSRLEID